MTERATPRKAEKPRMKAKQQRLVLAVCAGLAVVSAGFFAASALREEAAYFRTPSEIIAGKAKAGEAMRLGAMVQVGSLTWQANGVSLHFVASDDRAQVPVEFTGILPDLFREGSGMVADGRLRPDGVFVADRILAKHDERYMPLQEKDSIAGAGASDAGSAGASDAGSAGASDAGSAGASDAGSAGTSDAGSAGASDAGQIHVGEDMLPRLLRSP